MLYFVRGMLFFASISGVCLGGYFLYTRKFVYNYGREAPELYVIIVGFSLLVGGVITFWQNISGRFTTKIKKWIEGSPKL